MFMMFLPKPPNRPQADEVTVPCGDKELIGYSVDCFMELGFDPLEAVGLVASGISPSGLREFLRHNPDCDARTAVAILI